MCITSKYPNVTDNFRKYLCNILNSKKPEYVLVLQGCIFFKLI